MMSNEWRQTEENDEVPTSPDLWRPLDRHLGGFDLDPAAGCEPTPIAEERYTPEDDGLSSPWFGTVWLNPPFSEKTPWYRRLASQYRIGNVERAAAVSTVDPSADWFHEYTSTSDAVLFLDGRDWYLDHGSSPSFSTMVGLWNPTPEAVEWANSMGTVAHFSNEQNGATLENWVSIQEERR
jgi:hypothetical protein